jgi:2-amino-4-hydroxy-6-hydroxymethyldihydropteridine diphosphokinase
VNAEARTPVAHPNRWVVVALGSNLGDPAANLQAAGDELAALATGPLLRSSFWRTAPVDCPPGSPDFVNAVVAWKAAPDETPESLLASLQAIERKLGRQRKGVVNEARTLDLDLILFGQEQRATPELTLPHPRAHLRRFVLEPLEEILPDCRAPGWPASARELLSQLPDSEPARRTTKL